VRVGAKPIKFVQEINHALPSRVLGDELRIKQVLNNLITNAIKYTERGSITFSIKHRFEGDDVVLCFAVSDSGQGMTQEDLANIFSKYTRVNVAANRAIEGTGLGLSITKQLVERMGGTISVESEYGKGSCFTFEIKQKCVECTLVDFTTEQPAKDFYIKRSPMPYGRVLVVDDVSVNLYIADGYLNFYRLTIEQAESGFEALDKISAGKEYDIIFMDHMMPNMDGIETTRCLRKMGYEGTIVALTANALVGNDEMFMQNGFDGFMSKPMDIWELDEVLNKFIRDRHPEEAAKYTEEQTAAAAPIVMNPLITQALRRDTNSAIFALQQAQSSNDTEAIAAAAHSMKSALANIGEHEAAQMAINIEDAARNNATAYLAAHTGVFVAMLQALERSLGDDAFRSTTSNDDASFLNDNLTIIKVACQNYDAPKAFAALEKLEAREWTPQTTELLASIKKMLYSDSDFDGVNALIS
jgi:CheY-like chemotaxis protein/HPt (histidine-containing phosphotransfer) domain-containing protein/anti-sigma regulatory factor (Ser/Thr protein kinase)